MGKHEHHGCDHELKYCKQCDKAYCTKCNKEVAMNHFCTPCYLPHYGYQGNYIKPQWPWTNPQISYTTSSGQLTELTQQSQGFGSGIACQHNETV